VLHATLLPDIERPQRPARELGAFLLRPTTVAVILAAAALLVGARWMLTRPAARPAAEVLGRISVPGWIVLALAAAMLAVAVRAPELKRRLYASDSTYALAFVDYLDRPRVGLVLAFLMLYRTGESFLLNMAYPFLASVGVSRAEYGLAYGTFGIAASITGGILGGAAIARWGLARCIWPFVLCQNVLNLLYLGLAWSSRGWSGTAPLAAEPSLALVTALIVVEAFGAGLGTAAFMVFVMRTTRPAHKAAHMAIATGIATVSATLAGVVSGFLADALGFTVYFGLTFLATLPSMAMIPFLPGIRDGEAER
jgi:PAT family beta-lactamase induction signal transducer AmpG